MAGLRLRSRPAAVVALLALLLQLALSFDHVHLAHADWAAAAIAAATSDFAVIASPPQRGSDEDPDDYCSTCAILALLTGSQIAVAPVLAAPAVHTIAVAPIVAVAVRLVRRHDAFRSRAPPHS